MGFTKEARELLDYIYALNEKASGGFLLTADLKHWSEYGITTKDQLGDYLDECVERENSKYDSTESNDDDYDGHWDPIEPTWDAVSRHDSCEGW
jgi:hypothetical protein